MYRSKNAKGSEKILVAYLGDYKKGLHVREIAKSVNISPSAASYMTRHLEKRRILDHRMEGRNKKFFINSENPAAKSMIASAEIERRNAVVEKHFIIRKIVSEVDFEGRMAVLFGSFAKGLENEGSDIDVLLLGSGKQAKKKLEGLGKLYGKKIQIISMGREDFILREKREFVREVMKSHVVLSGADEFVDMLWRVYNAP